MAAEHQFLLDLTIVLGAAAGSGYLVNRLRQPVLLGYLLSGLVLGPSGLGFIAETEAIEALAEMGIAFLLFALGVEFSLAELRRVQNIAIKGGLLQIGLTIISVAAISTWAGWTQDWIQGCFVGAVLSLSSTAVILKTLTEQGETNTNHGQIMLAVLIVQDLAVGVMLSILPALNNPENLLGSLAIAILKAVLVLTGALAAGYWLVPIAMRKVAETESDELFLLAVIALCLSVALITAGLGMSIEMGAFVAGLMVAEVDYADKALSRIVPLRDTFASIFFVSIGMLIDPQILWQNLPLILSFVALVMLGKALILFPIVLNFNYSFKTATIVALGLNQIGEFSFVLALAGWNLGLIAEQKYLLLLGTTAITLAIAPLSLKFAPRLADKLLQVPAIKYYLHKYKGRQAFALPKPFQGHVVVAGYGRVGQAIVRILHDLDYEVLAIENSEAAVQRLRQKGIAYLFGDADSELVLEKAHLPTAKALAIALPDPASTRLLVKRALSLAPELDIVVRCHENKEIDLLTQLGAREVVQPEFEAGLEMGAHILATLGQPALTIQDTIQDIRTARYLKIRPERSPALVREDISHIQAALHSEWLVLPAESPLAGQTLAKADIRQRTGVAIVAIQNERQTLYYPKGDTMLQEGDRLLVLGSRGEVADFQAILRTN